MEAVRRERPDLVFLDVKMPRLDGIHTAKLIHGEKLAPVILLTAYSQPDIVDEAAKSGVFAYLVKPVNPRQFVSGHGSGRISVQEPTSKG